MRRVTLASQFIPIGKIFPTPFPFRFTVLIQLEFEWIGIFIQFTLHMTSQIEVTSMGNSFQLSIFTFRQEGKGIFNVRCTD